MKRRNIVAFALAAIIIAIQFIPVDRSNPPIQSDIQAPSSVSDILRRSCYDCHSHETHWPWYSRIAPISWFLAHHIHEGREKLNFSQWNELSTRKQSETIHEIWEETSKGHMPLRSYLIMHPKAKLTEEELTLIRTWSESPRKKDVSD